MGVAPTERLKIEETDGSSSRQEGIGVALTFLGGEMISKLRKYFPPWSRWPGQKELGGEDGQQNKQKLEGSRSPKFRHERTCRSCYV